MIPTKETFNSVFFDGYAFPEERRELTMQRIKAFQAFANSRLNAIGGDSLI